MNTKELNGFLQICKEKSITKAAKTLDISPQGLSKMIKNIENELDVELFKRTTSGIEITEYGYAFVKRAKNILKELEYMNSEMKNIKEDKRKDIRLASSYEIFRYLKPDCIIQFKKENPDINLLYQEYPDIRVDERILNDDADIGLAIGPVDDENLEKKFLKSFKVYLLVNKEHPLVHKKVIKYEDLNNVDFIFESKLFKLSNILKSNLDKMGIRYNVIFEASGFSLCHKLCDMNKGVSLTVDFINKDMGSEKTVLIPFEDDSLEWCIYLIRRKDLKKSTAINKFEKFILDWIE